MTLQELIKLIYNSSIQELKEYREQGVDFKLTDPHNQNNILIAYCGYGYNQKYSQTEMVNFLIECGNHVNSHRNN